MLTLFSALLAIAPVGSPESQHPAQPALTCEVSDIRSPQTPRRRHSFRATRIVDLELEARLHGRSKHERWLRLHVYTPRGFLYQVLELPLDSAASRWRVFEARLPVAGTSIMASGLYGRWKVVPHFDDRREPCGRGRSFVIKP
jgi:hypothetical protein